MARAVRDNIADMLSTLPRLLDRNEPAQIHFYFANISSMRKLIFPSLQQGYKHWLENHNTTQLNQLITQASEHWINIADQIIRLYKSHGTKAQTRIETLINNNYL